MTKTQRKCLLVGAFAMALLAGCATVDPRLSRETQYLGGEQPAVVSRESGLPMWDNVSYWDGQGSSGPARVEIDLRLQRALFYKGGELAGVSTVSTGREGFNTPPGTFHITQKNPDHRSNLYGDYVGAAGNIVVKNVDARKDPIPPGAKFAGAPMPNFMRFNGGIGMHAGYLPGHPASHGCVRLPPKMAQHFFDNVSIGTTVTVIN